MLYITNGILYVNCNWKNKLNNTKNIKKMGRVWDAAFDDGI